MYSHIPTFTPLVGQNKSSEGVLLDVFLTKCQPQLWKTPITSLWVCVLRNDPFAYSGSLSPPPASVLDDHWKKRKKKTSSSSSVMGAVDEKDRETAAQLSRGIQTCLLWRCFNKESRDCEIAWSHCSTHFTASLYLTPRLPRAPGGYNNNPTAQIAWTEMFVLP